MAPRRVSSRLHAHGDVEEAERLFFSAQSLALPASMVIQLLDHDCGCSGLVRAWVIGCSEPSPHGSYDVEAGLAVPLTMGKEGGRLYTVCAKCRREFATGL
jgi:hypothetical protein